MSLKSPETLDKEIADHQENHALIQMSADQDEIDAVLDKVKNLKREREKLTSAVTVLEMHLLNLSCDLRDARSEAMASLLSGSNGPEGSSNHPEDASESCVQVDCSEHEFYKAELVEILSP